MGVRLLVSYIFIGIKEVWVYIYRYFPRTCSRLCHKAQFGTASSQNMTPIFHCRQRGRKGILRAACILGAHLDLRPPGIQILCHHSRSQFWFTTKLPIDPPSRSTAHMTPSEHLIKLLPYTRCCVDMHHFLLCTLKVLQPRNSCA